MRWCHTAVLVVVLVSHGVRVAHSADGPDLGRAKALIGAGKAEEAWRLLAPHERQQAGRPDFDYLLGIAALESGRPNRATFILERVIAVNPAHVAARLEMARSYFALRDFERAEREFNAILRTDPPAAIHAVVSSYLDRMRSRAPTADPALGGYAEFTLGRDTNVNAATAEGTVFVPGLGADFMPDLLGSRQRDSFAALGAGVEFGKHLSEGRTFFAGTDFAHRRHSDLDVFDSRTADLRFGLHTPLDERDSLRYTLRHNQYDLDNMRYRRMQSAAAQWTRLFGERARISFSAHGYRIRYLREDVQASSSDLLGVGMSGAKVVDESTRTTVIGSLLIGIDNATAGRADGDRRLLGVSTGLQRRLHPRAEGYATLSLLNSNYQQANADFGVTRRDRHIEGAFGLSWRIAASWFLRPQISWTHHRSNLSLNEYRGAEAALTLRRVWE
jgi:outer membrane protein